MPKSTTNLNLSLYDSVTDKDNYSKTWFDEMFGYTNSNMTKIDDFFGGLKESVPTKTGEGAYGDWDINISGTAQSAIHDGKGNDINSTYVKDVTSDDGILTIEKGDGNQSKIDVSSPKGYVISKEAFFEKGGTSETWWHIGNIKNTSDSDFMKVELNIFARDSSSDLDFTFSQNYFIYDKQQDSPELLNTAYSFFTRKCTNASVMSSTTQNVFLVPTSGGNGTSCAELWISSLSYNTKALVTVKTSSKNKWEFILEKKNNITSSEFKISPLSETQLIQNTDYATSYSAGVVRIGNGVSINGSGIISIAPATSGIVGGVKKGKSVQIASDGTIDVPIATKSSVGVIKIGDGLNINDQGLLSTTLPIATTTTLGGVKVGSGLTVSTDGTLDVESSSNPLAAYPVGSIYQSTSSTSPAALFGGTWEQIASERVLMGASSSHAAGTTVKAGLPNITGTANGGVLSISKPSSNGAFGATEYTSNYSYHDGEGSLLRMYNRTFDASKSNAVYGASSTVQPAAYYVYIWHRVA